MPSPKHLPPPPCFIPTHTCHVRAPAHETPGTAHLHGRAVLLHTALQAGPSNLQLHNPRSALGRNQDGRWRLLQKELFPQSPAPSVPTVCSAEAEKDSTWVRRSLAAGAQVTTGTLVLLFLSPLTLPAASVGPTGMKLGLGFTSESQGHLRLRSIQPPPSRSPVDLVFSLTFWTFLEVSVCTLEDLLFISHQSYKFLFLVGFPTQPCG